MSIILTFDNDPIKDELLFPGKYMASHFARLIHCGEFVLKDNERFFAMTNIYTCHSVRVDSYTNEAALFLNNKILIFCNDDTDCFQTIRGIEEVLLQQKSRDNS